MAQDWLAQMPCVVVVMIMVVWFAFLFVANSAQARLAVVKEVSHPHRTSAGMCH
jgi:hypothetical protein